MFVRFRRLIKKASTTMEYGVVAAGIGLAIITLTDWARCCRSEFKRREDLPRKRIDLSITAFKLA
jgi:hypothetical protein